MKVPFFSIALLVGLAGLSSADQDIDVIEYYGAHFRIPAPEGFQRFDTTYPQLAEPIRRGGVMSSDLLAAYGTPQEILDRASGRSTHFKIVFLVTEDTSLRSADLTPDRFNQIKSELKNAAPDFQGLADRATEAINDYLQKEENPTDEVRLQQTHIVETFDERPNSICVLMSSKVKLTTNGATESFSALAAIAFLNLNKRLVLLNCSGEYHGAETVTSFKTQLAKWRDQVISLNSAQP